MSIDTPFKIFTKENIEGGPFPDLGVKSDIKKLPDSIKLDEKGLETKTYDDPSKNELYQEYFKYKKDDNKDLGVLDAETFEKTLFINHTKQLECVFNKKTTECKPDIDKNNEISQYTNDVIVYASGTGTGKTALLPLYFTLFGGRTAPKYGKDWLSGDEIRLAKTITLQPRKVVARETFQTFMENANKFSEKSPKGFNTDECNRFIAGSYVREGGETSKYTKKGLVKQSDNKVDWNTSRSVFCTTQTLFNHLVRNRYREIETEIFLIDEAHERAVELDLTLALIVERLVNFPRRHKLIIISATIPEHVYINYFLKYLPKTMVLYSNITVKKGEKCEYLVNFGQEEKTCHESNNDVGAMLDDSKLGVINNKSAIDSQLNLITCLDKILEIEKPNDSDEYKNDINSENQISGKCFPLGDKGKKKRGSILILWNGGKRSIQQQAKKKEEDSDTIKLVKALLTHKRIKYSSMNGKSTMDKKNNEIEGGKPKYHICDWAPVIGGGGAFNHPDGEHDQNINNSMDYINSKVDKGVDEFIPVIVFGNVTAEASLTLPTCSYVIDDGLDRKVGYDQENGLPYQYLTLVTTESAKQRCGRTGRTNNGICFTSIYKDDFFKPITSNPKIKNESLTKTQIEYLFNYNIDILKLPLIEEPKEAEKQILEDNIKILKEIEFTKEPKKAIHSSGYYYNSHWESFFDKLFTPEPDNSGNCGSPTSSKQKKKAKENDTNHASLKQLLTNDDIINSILYYYNSDSSIELTESIKSKQRADFELGERNKSPDETKFEKIKTCWDKLMLTVKSKKYQNDPRILDEGVITHGYEQLKWDTDRIITLWTGKNDNEDQSCTKCVKKNGWDQPFIWKFKCNISEPKIGEPKIGEHKIWSLCKKQDADSNYKYFKLTFGLHRLLIQNPNLDVSIKESDIINKGSWENKGQTIDDDLVVKFTIGGEIFFNIKSFIKKQYTKYKDDKGEEYICDDIIIDILDKQEKYTEYKEEYDKKFFRGKQIFGIDKSTSNIHINNKCSFFVNLNTFPSGPYFSGKNNRILKDMSDISVNNGGLPYSKTITNYPKIPTSLPNEFKCVPTNNKYVIAYGNYLIKDQGNNITLKDFKDAYDTVIKLKSNTTKFKGYEEDKKVKRLPTVNNEGEY